MNKSILLSRLIKNQLVKQKEKLVHGLNKKIIKIRNKVKIKKELIKDKKMKRLNLWNYYKIKFSNF